MKSFPYLSILLNLYTLVTLAYGGYPGVVDDEIWHHVLKVLSKEHGGSKIIIGHPEPAHLVDAYTKIEYHEPLYGGHGHGHYDGGYGGGHLHGGYDHGGVHHIGGHYEGHHHHEHGHHEHRIYKSPPILSYGAPHHHHQHHHHGGHLGHYGK